MTRYAFIDTETDSLGPNRPVWEIGIITVDNPGDDDEHVTRTHLFLPLDAGRGDTQALNIGGYWERHPAAIAALADKPAPVAPLTAVREAARVRLYERVPWLDAALIAAVQTYAGDIRIDTDAIEEKLRDIDPQDAEALQGALAGNLFSPEPSDAQKRTLAHLENLLALVEGWVDVVTDAAVAQHLQRDHREQQREAGEGEEHEQEGGGHPPDREDPGEALPSRAAPAPGGQSAPFVDGTPDTRGSDSHAARRARATALYSASVM